MLRTRRGPRNQRLISSEVRFESFRCVGPIRLRQRAAKSLGLASGIGLPRADIKKRGAYGDRKEVPSMTGQDKRVLKHYTKSEISAVAEILRRWDPINVQPSTVAPASEYDSYAPHILSMLKGGCTVEDLAAHLEHLATETMGLGPSSNRTRAYSLEFATQIVDQLRRSPGTAR